MNTEANNAISPITAIDDDGDEVITLPGIATGEETQIESPETTEEEVSSDVVPPTVTEDEDEQRRIIELGKQALEYEKARPGFKFVDLQKDYTKKAQEAADAKRALKLFADEPVATDPEEDISDIAEGDVALIERVLKSKGYVKREEVMESKTQVRQRTEQELIGQFIAAHPEYSSESDPDGSRWEALKGEFNLYDKTQREDATKTLALLEKAHRIVAPIPSNAETIRKIAEQKRNRLGTQISENGGSGGNISTETPKVSTKAANLIANLRGFSEEEKQKIIQRLSNK